MAKGVLQQARILMRRRKFGTAIRFLESYIANYKGSFEYYLALGTSCLYAGDEGNAGKYYKIAREIRINNSELLLGQAAIFLRRGETSKALSYYLDILNIDPGNETARDAMEFIRFKGNDFNEIQRLKQNGKIERFYPPLGINPDIIRNCVLIGLALGIIISPVIVLRPREGVKWNGDRGNLSNLELTNGEQRNAVAQDLAAGTVHYILDNDTVNQCYEDAVMYYQNQRDNPARVQINRLLNSNATASIKQKAYILQSYLSEITFDKLKSEDNYTYSQVDSDHVLYNGCYVAWTGTIADPKTNDDGSWQCKLLVGYHEGKHVDDIVPVIFTPENFSPVNPDRPIRILGVVTEQNGRITLSGRSIYQPVSGKFQD